MKKIIIFVAALSVAGLAAWFFLWRENNQTVKYKTVKVERGAIESSVSATGTLNAVVTVQVGSQVSGTIKELYADFNSAVKKDQVIARLDQKTFIAQRDQAKANLINAGANVEKSNADLIDKKQKFDRVSKLYKEGLIAQSERDSAEAAYNAGVAQLKSAEAQVEQYKASLELAEVNLDYTVIKSPVDGIVISRNVDIGQTVAASFQTPTLFTIAKDLTKMQVNTSVDEADIGAVRVGQEATFTVDAYPELIFKGMVSQIRNAPIIVQNVVTYDVIIEVANKEMKLKPGMTANVSIVTYHGDAVFKVSNAALRFKPVEDNSLKQEKEEKGVKVWLLNNDQIKPVYIKTGVSDGNYTEIIEGDIKEGDEVIVDMTGKKNKSNKAGAPGFHGFVR
ncbi:MAG: efflux transporter periplasmic adaptor subunit [Deltaproteobacteria bacterium RIFCSPLOWO2_12_FULL_43_16]|nr:MAG: efflux transporter periplasmic adaptor subunit [Deltaproteobacteria bacterium GWA2_43_19]OGQ10421.1 MAG: efflux transporter periplasmic adaptor subunit [Deltaproteobacteria bacterium RIFCSPHIGHO2_02_FULL_43_33]OGQ59245.1 MAG: efflux transporter periplasmic adaptor subunit [Deltaproteobacteria bacterium RIFCSPLOWO2_12_FULL_43_16]HBR18517.1 efflux RND transporter periplasmic adaptor subunit [Deltaproteobacteria bacterium]